MDSSRQSTSLLVLETRSPKSRDWQGQCLLGSLKESPFQISFLASGGCWQPLGSLLLWKRCFNVPHSTQCSPLSVSVFVCFPQGHQQLDLEPNLMQRLFFEGLLFRTFLPSDFPTRPLLPQILLFFSGLSQKECFIFAPKVSNGFPTADRIKFCLQLHFRRPTTVWSQ